MKTKQPLAEVFGFPISNQREKAKRYLEGKLCPYNNIVANCTKNRVDNPLGVCSMFHKGKPVIICPVRFRQDWTIVSDAADFIFSKGVTWTHLGEVRLKDKHGKSAGNIDYVLVAYDDKGRIMDFGSLEVQAVYISGNISGPFELYLENPTPDFRYERDKALYYPNPDYLSSSRKRLVPQIIAKGSIMNQWRKKQVIALQTAFYDTLPPLTATTKEHADIAFYLYDLSASDDTYNLKLERIIYLDFKSALEQIAKFEAGPLNTFTALLQEKLDLKMSGRLSEDETTKIVVE
jgi:hypothetical protein